MLPLLTKLPKTPLLLTAFAALLSGCASQQRNPSADQALITPQPTTTAEAVAVEKASFQPATLYALMVAELAGYRGLPRVTLHNYLQEAERTGDPGIARRAARLAGQMRNSEALLKASLIWAEAEPDNPTPYLTATKELIRQGQVDKAAPMLERALQLNNTDVVDALANRAQKMSPEERQTYLQLLDQLLEAQADDSRLLYARASLTVYEDMLPEALEFTRRSLNSAPDFDRAILLEADLQSRLGHLDTALGHLREELRNRDHKQMRTLYTRLLLEKKQYPLAQLQAETLLANNPDDYNLLFYIGVLMLEHGQLSSSRDYFSLLSERVGANSAISYYNGRIAHLSGDQQQALMHYQQVGDAPYLLASYTEISRLLSRNEDREQLASVFTRGREQYSKASPLLYALEAAWLTDRSFDTQAMELLNQALDAYPDNSRLRYSRAMLGEKLGDMNLLESDLRYLLEREPDNATALNALGYSLTDNTDRHVEALALIKRAMELKPEDPAILDSMGWAYYHLGDLTLALQYLERAYESFPDPEIAAHLGTVYWALGQTEQAMKIWNEALERDPDSQLIKDAVNAAQKDI